MLERSVGCNEQWNRKVIEKYKLIISIKTFLWVREKFMSFYVTRLEMHKKWQIPLWSNILKYIKGSVTEIHNSYIKISISLSFKFKIILNTIWAWTCYWEIENGSFIVICWSYKLGIVLEKIVIEEIGSKIINNLMITRENTDIIIVKFQ